MKVEFFLNKIFHTKARKYVCVCVYMCILIYIYIWAYVIITKLSSYPEHLFTERVIINVKEATMINIKNNYKDNNVNFLIHV